MPPTGLERYRSRHAKPTAVCPLGPPQPDRSSAAYADAPPLRRARSGSSRGSAGTHPNRQGGRQSDNPGTDGGHPPPRNRALLTCTDQAGLQRGPQRPAKE